MVSWMQLKFNLGKTSMQQLAACRPNLIFHILHSEAWKMYMADKGLRSTETGGINKDQYMRYRERIESVQPLSTELEHLKLGYLPPK